MEKTYFCTICKKQITTCYCGNCGQKVAVKKVTLWSLITDIFSNVFDLEKSMPVTLLALLITPVKIIDNYSKGYRNYYPSPGKILVYAITIGTLHVLLVNADILGLSVVDASVNDTPIQISAHVLLLVATIFFFSITSYLTFIATKTSFSKHIISMIYLTCTFFILLTLISDVILWLGWSLEEIPAAIYLSLILVWDAIVFSRKKLFFKILANLSLHILLIASLLLLLYFSGAVQFS